MGDLVFDDFWPSSIMRVRYPETSLLLFGQEIYYHLPDRDTFPCSSRLWKRYC